jgi:glutathione S-transferase
MLRIWGRTNSINVQKPLMALEECGVPYERIDAGLHFGVNKTAEYMAMNPNAVVPTIDDDGFILWESNAIARYVARKYGNGKLWPTDVRAQADQDRWIDWQHTTLVAPINACFAPLIRNMGDTRPDAIEAGRAKAEEKLAMLDAWLAGKAWIGGDFFGCAECVLGPSVHRWYHLPVERKTHENVERWLKALMSRPSARKVIVEPIS